MPVVVPQRIETVSVFAQRANESRILRLVLGDEHNLPIAGGLASPPADGDQNVLLRLVEDALRRVEPQAIEMKFVNPISRVPDEELPDAVRILAVEIDRIAPLVLIAAG